MIDSVEHAAGRRSILQPRLVMAVAVMILSFANLLQHTRTRLQHVHPANFHVPRMWTAAQGRAMRVENLAIEYYEDIRLIYRLERQLTNLQEQEASERNRDIARQTNAGRQLRRGLAPGSARITGARVRTRRSLPPIPPRYALALQRPLSIQVCERFPM